MVEVTPEVVVKAVYHAIHAATHKAGDERVVNVDNATWETIPEIQRQQIRRYAMEYNVAMFIKLRED
jgi:hypothetical protein